MQLRGRIKRLADRVNRIAPATARTLPPDAAVRGRAMLARPLLAARRLVDHLPYASTDELATRLSFAEWPEGDTARRFIEAARAMKPEDIIEAERAIEAARALTARSAIPPT